MKSPHAGWQHVKLTREQRITRFVLAAKLHERGLTYRQVAECTPRLDGVPVSYERARQMVIRGQLILARWDRKILKAWREAMGLDNRGTSA